MKIKPLSRKTEELARTDEGRIAPAQPIQWGRWLACLLVFVLVTVVTSPPVPWLLKPLVANQSITSPLVAEVSFVYTTLPDNAEWERERTTHHSQIYNFDSRVAGNVRGELHAIAQLAARKGLSTNQARAELAAINARFSDWTVEEVDNLLELCRHPPAREALDQALAAVYQKGMITPDALLFRGHGAAGLRVIRLVPGGEAPFQTTRDEFLVAYPDRSTEIAADTFNRALPASFPNPGTARATGERLLLTLIRPNVTYDAEASMASYRDYPRWQGSQVRVTKGDKIVNVEGGREHVVTAEEARLSDLHRRAVLQRGVSTTIAHALYVALVFLIVAIFLARLRRDFNFTTSNVLVLSLPCLLALALGRLFIVLAGNETEGAGYAFPAGVISMLGVLLIDARMALMLVIAGGLLFGLEVNMEFRHVSVALFGGFAGVAALHRIRERRDVLIAGLAISLVNFVAILLAEYISGRSFAWTQAALGAIGGFGCALLSLAVLPIFEVIFGITTDMKLLELAGLGHPLLTRLEDVAPGTWQHTLNVAKLAEAAAQDIGVNYLLVRAGVYFHDIGKMTRPEWFTENQLTEEDKRLHQKEKPQMSTLIIRNHVKEGLEMARKAGLPPRIIDFIPEHHGTSLIQYFHRKALAAYERGDTKEPVREEDYRYPGPKPQSIETALVMMADSVEATATARLSGRVVRLDEIRRLVRDQINAKFDDGQFDECNLTLSDLNRIRESFVQSLVSRFHTRIDYPSRPEPRRESRESRDREREPSRADEPASERRTSATGPR